MDQDGLPDGWEVNYSLNPEYVYDAMMDNDTDGLSNEREYSLGTNPRMLDGDSDGMPDGWEVDYGFDPVDPTDAAGDKDDDNVSNLEEFKKTLDPSMADSDRDGMPDGWELANELDPNLKSDADDDPDGDGMTNLEEYDGEHDPNVKDNPEQKPNENEDDDPEPTGGTGGDGPSSKSELPWAVIIIVSIVLVLGIGGLVVALVLRGKEADEGDDLGRVSPEGGDAYQELYGSEEAPAEAAAPSVMTEYLSPEGSGGPACPGCGKPSEFFPEYDCYWCEPCQEYVMTEKPPVETPAVAREKKKTAVRRRVVRKTL